MKIDLLLEEYAASHRHPTNKLIHRIAVPIIAVDMLGLADAIPNAPLAAAGVPGFGTIAAVAALVYYARLSPPLAMAMALPTAVALALIHTGQIILGAAAVPLLVAIFALAWAAQFYGHALEGKKPSFLRDLQFLLIGPLWVLADAVAKIGPLRRFLPSAVSAPTLKRAL